MRFFLFIKLLFKIKKIFYLPRYSEVVIFDNHGSNLLKKSLKNFSITILRNRINEIDKLYINFYIFTGVIRNFFKANLKIVYLSQIIKFINPKFVITLNDNSTEYFQIKKLLGDKFKFYAVQRADRIYDRELIKNITLDKYFTFSQYEKNILIRKKAKIKNIIPIGSLACSSALDNAKTFLKKYDICLISEPRNINNIQDMHVKKQTILLAEYVLKFCSKHNLKLIVSGESKKNTYLGKLERLFYKDLKNKKYFKIDQSRKSEFSSYYNIFKSNVTIGLKSTMLREAIGAKKKVFICSFSKYSDDISPIRCLINLKKPNYNLFEKRLIKILNLSNKKYFHKFNNEIKKIISNCYETKSKLIKNI